jgi:hypothetical protein
MDMLEQANSIINKKSKKCKDLQKKLDALEKLGKAHTKLEKTPCSLNKIRKG